MSLALRAYLHRPVAGPVAVAVAVRRVVMVTMWMAAMAAADGAARFGAGSARVPRRSVAARAVARGSLAKLLQQVLRRAWGPLKALA